MVHAAAGENSAFHIKRRTKRRIEENFMGRPFTGRRHVGERRETRPNGDVYVYERVTEYDPETKRTKTVSTRLLGKIPAGSTEMIPTRPKRRKTVGETQALASSSPSSSSLPAEERFRSLLDWAGEASGIDADLREVFPDAAALGIAAVARFRIASEGASLSRLEAWGVTHPLPSPEPLTEEDCEALFEVLGRSEAAMDLFFRLRAAREDQKARFLVLDAAAPSFAAPAPVFADADDEPPRLVILYSIGSGMPVAFAEPAKNLPADKALVKASQSFDFAPSQRVVAADGDAAGFSGIARRVRERTERFFSEERRSAAEGPAPLRPEVLLGRLFMDFVALQLHAFLTLHLDAVREGLDADASGGSSEEAALEAELRAWLENRSLVQVLDWFDGVRFAADAGHAGAAAAAAASARRDALLLRRLGAAGRRRPGCSDQASVYRR